MTKSYERCLELVEEGRIRRTVAFTYEDTAEGETWDELVYALAEDGRVALDRDGTVRATGEVAEQKSTRAVRRRRAALADPFQTTGS